MLDLNSPEWTTLVSSPGGDGAMAASLLLKLKGGDESSWDEFHHQVCHHGSVSEVGYVAAPHVVEIARKAEPPLMVLLLSTLGSIEASRKCYANDAAEMRDEWWDEYSNACKEACILASDALKDINIDGGDSLQLIGVLAAFHGHPNLALLLECGPEISCPICGDPIEFGEG